MNIKTVDLRGITTQILFIGLEGEQNHTRIVFNVPEILGAYPDATVGMTIKPPQGSIYPKAVEKSGTTVVWDVSAADCGVVGDGEYQITFTDGNEIIKTFIGLYRVGDSLTANGSAPDPIEDWIEDANAVLGELNDLSASAEGLPAGSEPTAQVTQVGGHKNIAFGIPAGEKGDPGNPGAPGKDGKDGTDGFSPVVSVEQISGGHEISIEDAQGTHTFDVMDGEAGHPGAPGKDGKDGTDGFSPVVSVSAVTGGHQVSITDAEGTETFDVMDGTPVIDDQAGAGDTDKVWSADKSYTEDQELLSAINAKYTKPSSGIPASDLASGVIPSVPVTDVQVNGTSILSNGVANVPVADSNNPGVAKSNSARGVEVNNYGVMQTVKATDAQTKAGADQYKPIVPYNQHQSVFYGLAKAAGNSDQSSSSNAVGTYTEDAISKIHGMLDAPVTVSGSTPSITAKSGVRYICGEVSTLTITVPDSGCIDVIFTSGSTPTVLTVTPTKSGVTAVKFPSWFDPTSLDANTVYEINIMDGEYGVVASWT